MPKLHSNLPRERFLSLPDHGAAPSVERRVGVEIEFAGLSVEQAAAVLQQHWGGEIERAHERALQLKGSALGKIEVELDIALKRQWTEDLAEQVLGDLIPVEVITDPLPQTALPQVEMLAAQLCSAGALGTREKLAYGFGIHFNVELPQDDGAALISTARAYGLCEDWLRAADPLDPARRVLPFVAPWPRPFVAALAGGVDWSLRELARACAQLAPSRQYGLDLLPALQHFCPDELAEVHPDHLKGGRPVFHYRLPETRLGEADWSLAYEWNRWCVIEHVATDPALLEGLSKDWTVLNGPLSRLSGSWAEHVGGVLSSSSLAQRMGLEKMA